MDPKGPSHIYIYIYVVTPPSPNGPTAGLDLTLANIVGLEFRGIENLANIVGLEFRGVETLANIVGLSACSSSAESQVHRVNARQIDAFGPIVLRFYISQCTRHGKQMLQAWLKVSDLAPLSFQKETNTVSRDFFRSARSRAP